MHRRLNVVEDIQVRRHMHPMMTILRNDHYYLPIMTIYVMNTIIFLRDTIIFMRALLASNINVRVFTDSSYQIVSSQRPKGLT